MKKIIVYDFDKTLTYKDTLLDFFKFIAKKNIYYPFKLLIYFIFMVLCKFRIVSNSRLKEIGVSLFLKGLTKEKFIEDSKKYAKVIKLNATYKKSSFDKKNEYYIVSASFEDYIKPLFPEYVNIIASKIEYRDNLVKSLKINCYGYKKVEILKNIGIDKIDLLFTDSFSDYPLATISNKIVVVSKDKERICNSLDEFKGVFKK